MVARNERLLLLTGSLLLTAAGCRGTPVPVVRAEQTPQPPPAATTPPSTPAADLPALKDPSRVDLVPLRRFDIVYVPRTSAAEAGVFMGQVRDILPFTFSYSLNNPYSR